MKTLQKIMVNLLDIRYLKKRTDVRLFSKVIDKNTFCIYSNSIGLYDFAWFCFNVAIPEHKEPYYWDWDELHGLENGCHYFDTYKIEKDRYHPPNNPLWTNEDHVDFNFEYTLENDPRSKDLQTTVVCIPSDLKALKQSCNPHSQIFVDYEPAIVQNPNLIYDPKYVIYANSAGWYELGKITLFLSKSESKTNSVLLSEADYLYKNSLPLRLSKSRKIF
jgi:hypothetical protein